MKEDYLWDKKGSDSEIENLENALKVFRQKDATPPELPAKTFAFEKKEKRYFKFALVSFACLALTIFSFGIFQVISLENKEIANEKPKQITNEKNSVVISENKTSDKIISKSEDFNPKFQKAKFSSKPKIQKRLRKFKKQINQKSLKQKNFAKKSKRKTLKRKPKTNTIRLTKEEKEAYDKLMQALAITSSHLKIVREKIRGDEDKEINKSR